ncbi:hypothetical protein SAPIO_CDS3786 [Scedosporium apiospermum]|uniref:Methyltransferase domain-containing protein n=1 Tax=Pseudallescheria apiosperma TaxID=563466 RepID=A0A084G9N6_PSEDA|nr:uncharacterized protein SAPIO_CDS3786 [Scedosporium apiospermum]KEZ44048.1 hypothetical protein SAPIO_CDS3786 [Scedosporium apiospermum]
MTGPPGDDPTLIHPDEAVDNDDADSTYGADESLRLELQHHMFTLTYDGQLYVSPAAKDKPVSRVLDCGTGTGIWAIDFADEHPDAAIIGVDLSPTQPAFVPPNVNFYVDDLEEEWVYSSKFDFIHARMLTGSIADWPKLFKQSFDNLEPGGWFEVSDITFPLQCDDTSFPETCELSKWSDLMMEASRNLKRPLDSAYSYKKQLEEAGFVNVVERRFKWPHNHWPKNKKYKELGTWACENIANGASGLSLALFTRGLGWSAEEVEVFLSGVRKDMRNVRMHTYYTIIVVYGQKPEEAADSAAAPQAA